MTENEMLVFFSIFCRPLFFPNRITKENWLRWKKLPPPPPPTTNPTRTSSGVATFFFRNGYEIQILTRLFRSKLASAYFIFFSVRLLSRRVLLGLLSRDTKGNWLRRKQYPPFPQPIDVWRRDVIGWGGGGEDGENNNGEAPDVPAASPRGLFPLWRFAYEISREPKGREGGKGRVGKSRF